MNLNKGEKYAVFIAVVLAFIFLFVSMTFFNTDDSNIDEVANNLEGGEVNDPLEDDEANQSGNGGSSQEVEGLEIQILEEGSGSVAQSGDVVSVHYVGTLQSGAKFDSSRDRGQPFEFTLGSGQVIQGWELGVEGMAEGEVRRLTIDPELAYGANQVGPIPANSTLVFEVELLEVK